MMASPSGEEDAGGQPLLLTHTHTAPVDPAASGPAALPSPPQQAGQQQGDDEDDEEDEDEEVPRAVDPRKKAGAGGNAVGKEGGVGNGDGGSSSKVSTCSAHGAGRKSSVETGSQQQMKKKGSAKAKHKASSKSSSCNTHSSSKSQPNGSKAGSQLPAFPQLTRDFKHWPLWDVVKHVRVRTDLDAVVLEVTTQQFEDAQQRGCLKCQKQHKRALKACPTSFPLNPVFLLNTDKKELLGVFRIKSVIKYGTGEAIHLHRVLLLAELGADVYGPLIGTGMPPPHGVSRSSSSGGSISSSSSSSSSSVERLMAKASEKTLIDAREASLTHLRSVLGPNPLAAKYESKRLDADSAALSSRYVIPKRKPDLRYAPEAPDQFAIRCASDNEWRERMWGRQVVLVGDSSMLALYRHTVKVLMGLSPEDSAQGEELEGDREVQSAAASASATAADPSFAPPLANREWRGRGSGGTVLKYVFISKAWGASTKKVLKEALVGNSVVVMNSCFLDLIHSESTEHETVNQYIKDLVALVAFVHRKKTFKGLFMWLGSMPAAPAAWSSGLYTLPSNSSSSSTTTTTTTTSSKSALARKTAQLLSRRIPLLDSIAYGVLAERGNLPCLSVWRFGAQKIGDLSKDGITYGSKTLGWVGNRLAYFWKQHGVDPLPSASTERQRPIKPGEQVQQPPEKKPSKSSEKKGRDSKSSGPPPAAAKAKPTHEEKKTKKGGGGSSSKNNDSNDNEVEEGGGGESWRGKRVAKNFMGVVFPGTVNAFVPASETEEGMDLYGVLYDDQDSEDLNTAEVLKGFELFQSHYKKRQRLPSAEGEADLPLAQARTTKKLKATSAKQPAEETKDSGEERGSTPRPPPAAAAAAAGGGGGGGGGASAGGQLRKWTAKDSPWDENGLLINPAGLSRGMHVEVLDTGGKTYDYARISRIKEMRTVAPFRRVTVVFLVAKGYEEYIDVLLTNEKPIHDLTMPGTLLRWKTLTSVKGVITRQPWPTTL